MRRLAFLAVLLFAVLPAVAAVEEVSLPITPFIFDHQLGIQVGPEIRLTNGLGLALTGMAGRTSSVDGFTTTQRRDALVWPTPQPQAFHVPERSARGVAFTLRVPIWKPKKK